MSWLWQERQRIESFWPTVVFYWMAARLERMHLYNYLVLFKGRLNIAFHKQFYSSRNTLYILVTFTRRRLLPQILAWYDIIYNLQANRVTLFPRHQHKAPSSKRVPEGAIHFLYFHKLNLMHAIFHHDQKERNLTLVCLPVCGFRKRRN